MGSVFSSPKSVTGSVFSSRSTSLGSYGTRKSSIQSGEPTRASKTTEGEVLITRTASLDSIGTRKSSLQSGQPTGASKTEKGEVLTSPTASLSSKTFGNRIVGSYPRKYSSLKLVFPSTDQCREEKAEPIDDKVHVKTLHVVEASTENKRLETVKSDGSIHISPFPQSPGKPVDDNVQGKTLHIVEAATGSKPVPSDDTIEDNVQVKTLHVVEPATENKILEPVKTDGIHQNSPSISPVFQSPESLPPHGDEVKEHEYTDVKDVEHSDNSDGEDYEDSEYTDTYDSEESEYAESETDEFISENNDGVDKSKGNHKRNSRKAREITSEHNDSALTKSKFRRGRIVDINSEDNVPRKLKFRRGRVVENEDGSKTYVRRRRFKKREVGDDANEAKADSEQVVLRHQEQQEKVEQGLLNNVIEETATKLADERKSKVQALVGAFETVMSLQDQTQES